MTAPDYAAWRFWFGVAQFAATIAVWIYVWWTNRAKVNATRFAELEKQVAQRAVSTDIDARCGLHMARTVHVEAEIIRLDSDFRHAPGHTNLARIHMRLDELNKAFGDMDGRLTGIERTVGLINEHLISKGDKT